MQVFLLPADEKICHLQVIYDVDHVEVNGIINRAEFDWSLVTAAPSSGMSTTGSYHISPPVMQAGILQQHRREMHHRSRYARGHACSGQDER